MDAVTFADDWSFRKADDPVPPISSVFELPTTPQVQNRVESGSQNSHRGDGRVTNSGTSTGTSQYGKDIPPHDQVEEESPSPSNDGKLEDDDGEPDDDEFIVPGDDEVMKG